MRQLPLLRFGAAVTVFPVALLASPFDGVYRQSANAECALVGVDGGSIKIENEIFYGVEVECRMINPVEIEGMNAVLYDMACIGEGSAWEERAIMMEDAQTSGILMIWDGYAFRYARCNDPAAAATEAAAE
ncbi:hypothetical protein [Yoonia sp.]|uniref:hypothetical protein n=1 Tax=Yoonia sp. TaxID=2212373 RepID=UPI002FDB5D5C